MSPSMFLVALSTLASAPTVSTPWGKAESAAEKEALEKTALCTDGKSHYVVLAPDEKQIRQLFYGDGSHFFAVPKPPWVLDGSMFLEPRFYSKTMNSSFRGVDLRVYSSVEHNDEKKTCAVRCGERTTALELVEPAKAKALLAAAKFDVTPQQFLPHVLLRDDGGKYYYVDRGFWPDQEKSFRLFAGPKGSLKLQKMTNVVSDSEGEIFTTKSGELRMVVDRVKPSLWIERGKKTELREVPVEANLQLIYNELGVYTGMRLGTPCDDLG
jgi:hypothetical protein